MHRIAERLESQYRAHPEGPHCENTKIWVFCNTAGGLGMHLYDKVFGKNTHQAFDNFIGYTRENYMKVGADGKLQSITSYYDPVEKFHFGANAARTQHRASDAVAESRTRAVAVRGCRQCTGMAHRQRRHQSQFDGSRHGQGTG
jgi:hypothetical protein